MAANAEGYRVAVAGGTRADLGDLCEGLGVLGHEVSAVCVTPREAVEEAEGQRPDMVFVMDGFEGQGGAQWIEAAGIIQNLFRIPVVMISSSGRGPVEGRIVDVEPAVCLRGLGPAISERLRFAVEVAMARHRDRRELGSRTKGAKLASEGSVEMDHYISDDRGSGGERAKEDRGARRSFVPLCALRKQALGGMAEVDAKIQQHREAVMTRGVCLECLAAVSGSRR